MSQTRTRSAGPIIEAGKRLAVCGRAGSGKSTLQKWFMLRSNLRWIIMDTKHDDDAFSGWNIMRGGLQSPQRIAREWRNNQYVTIRPSPKETKPLALDDYLGELHDAFENYGILLDEMYHYALGGQAGPGLTGLVTRGRARKQAVIMGQQRPARVPLFVLSEANAFAVMSLTLEQDRKRMLELTGQPVMMDRLEPRHWVYFQVDTEELTRYGPVTIQGVT